jgi:hypothetical protein
MAKRGAALIQSVMSSTSVRVEVCRLHHRSTAWANGFHPGRDHLLTVVERGSIHIERGSFSANLGSGCGLVLAAGAERHLSSRG